MGKGVGDLNIKAECNLVSKTYSIEDCWLYVPTSRTLNSFAVPNKFQIEATLKRTSSTASSFTVHHWFSSSRTVSLGVFNNQYGIDNYDRGWVDSQYLGTLNNNQSVDVTVTYENGVWTVTDGVTSKSLTQSIISPLYKLEIADSNTGTIRDYKLKPL